MNPSQVNTICFLILFVTSSSLIYLSEGSVDDKVASDPTSGPELVSKDINEVTTTTEKPVALPSSETKSEVVDCDTLLPGQYLCNELASIDPATQQPAGNSLWFGG